MASDPRAGPTQPRFLTQSRRIVVTGALGYVGSRLVPALSRAFPEADVVMIDNRSSTPCCPVALLATGARHTYVDADIATADLDPLLAGADAVVHLAAVADAAGSFADDARIAEENHAGALRIAQACARTGAALLFPSTTSVYATREEVVDEDCPASALSPQSPYAQSKLQTERALAALAASEGLRHVVCRIGTIFGPSAGMKFRTAVNKFCRQAVDGRALTVWRTAMHQLRPYAELGDAVAALVFLLDRAVYEGEVFNVLSLNTSVAEVVQAIASRVAGVEVQYVDSPAMNEWSFRVDAGRLAGLGFRASGTLGGGVGETLRALEAQA